MSNATVPVMLGDHPTNDDPTAVLVTMGRDATGREIFRTKQGFVACMPNSMALPVCFETQDKAQRSQRQALGWSEAIWGRLTAERVTSLSDVDLEASLGPCVCGPRLVEWAKALRDGGALYMDGETVELKRPATAA